MPHSVVEALHAAPGNNDPITIVGMGCRLPGGIRTPSDLWDLLIQQRSGLVEFPKSRFNLAGFYHPDPQRPGSFHTRGACLLEEDPALFDHSFFNMSTVQVMSLDPNQRKMLEVTYEAFENAGEPWNIFSGSRTGVFVGNMGTDHGIMQTYNADFCLPHASTGGSTSILSNRINHIFNLKGPSMTIDTACSSSMYALHLASNAIRNGDCDAAIVGGSNLITAPEMQVMTAKLGALSATSTCHTFDEAADGYGRGEGFGALYLKRYSDAVRDGNPIRAVLRGTAINSNGRTAGISHPSADGQEAVIRKAYSNAGISTTMTSYFECHGTGTPVGDPLEIAAIGRIFGPERINSSPLLIGSVKTNLGHSEAASGIVGIFKAILAIEKGIIPATIGVETLNPNSQYPISLSRRPYLRLIVDFNGAQVEVVTKATHWRHERNRRASINSFGYGGANGHCILDHPAVLRNDGKTLAQNVMPRLILLPFSAHNTFSLKSNMTAIHRTLKNALIQDIAYTLSSRRSNFDQKGFSIVDSISLEPTAAVSDQVLRPNKNDGITRLGFVFTGQGAQWQGMGASLMEFSPFRSSIKKMDRVLQSLSTAPSWKLEQFFSKSSSINVEAAEVSQTVCTALQVALVDLLATWRVTPTTCIGHSSGEIAAAYASGLISASEAIVVAHCRGYCVATNVRKGAMLAVGLPLEEALKHVQEFQSQVKIAAVNSPSSITLSGDPTAIEHIHATLAGLNIFVRQLRTGGNAYHSHHMDDIGRDYESLLQQELDQLKCYGATRDFTSASAVWISSVPHQDSPMMRAPSPKYWRKNLTSQVEFYQAVKHLLQDEGGCADFLVEIGPHAALKSPILEIAKTTDTRRGYLPLLYQSALKRNTDCMHSILQLCGNLFIANHEVNIGAINGCEGIENGSQGSVCIDLPPYQYHYGEPIYHENRIFREIKDRKHLRHDLLGYLQAGGSGMHPAWRNLLRVKDLPWLQDHRLLPHVVLPGAAYVALAVEALNQHLNIDREEPQSYTYQLRDVSIKSAMQIPEDDFGIDTVFNLAESAQSPNWFHFSMSSISRSSQKWTEHATGHISLIQEARPRLQNLRERIDPRIIEASDWYETFSKGGLGYGPHFQGLSKLRCDPLRTIATADIDLSPTKSSFSGPESPYVIHPASLDVLFQLAVIAAHGGHTRRFRAAFVPILIEDMTLWSASHTENIGRGVAQTHFKGLRGAHAQIYLETKNGDPMVEISNIRTVTHVGGDLNEIDTVQSASPHTRLIWKPDISTLSHSKAQNLFPPTFKAEKVVALFDLMEKVSLYMIAHVAEQFSSTISCAGHLDRLLDWARRTAEGKSPILQEAKSLDAETRLSTIETINRSLQGVIDITYTKRIFDNLGNILEGSTTGFEVVKKDDLLSQIYKSGIGIAAAYPQFERILDILVHQNPTMKVIEIGAGTGSATEVAMRSLTGGGSHSKWDQYVFTDVSSAFLQAAKARFGQHPRMVYKTLDFNQPVKDQGFESNFDLVIASECLHTAHDIATTLKTVRQLLKPGGRLIMIETTRTLPGHGIAYGTFADYWPTDLARESPFYTSDEWNILLGQSGFSGVDIELHDYPPPLQVASTIVTTATTDVDSGHHHPEVVYVIYDKLQDFHERLSKGISAAGLAPNLVALDDCDIPAGSRILLTTNVRADPLVYGTEHHFQKIQSLVSQSSSILWLTDGDMIRGGHPESAVVTGLVRMLITEDSMKSFGVMHLEKTFGEYDEDIINAIVQRERQIATGDFEREVAMHDGIAHISRLLVDDDLAARHRQMFSSALEFQESPIHDRAPVEAHFETTGLISSLYFRPTDIFNAPLGDTAVEVTTTAIGLNWKDIPLSAGKLDLNYFGLEFSGIVTRCGRLVTTVAAGDYVYGFALHKYGNVIRVESDHVRSIPIGSEGVVMATVPIVFCTALYGLQHLARLQRGEKVLIQSAAGGLGLAAIQLARLLGAEIYVTVGNEEKAAFLRKEHGIAQQRIFSSRSISESSRMLEATDGTGFDVVLSSSSGDVMRDTLKALARRGRFIDVGRTDVQDHKVMALSGFSRNATFTSFDLSEIIANEPRFAASLLQEVDDMIKGKVLTPTPQIKFFDVSKLNEALLYLSTGSHIGKIAVNYINEVSIIKTLAPVPRVSFKHDAVYILIGGLGGLGRSILQWMVEHGARTFVVCNRTGLAPVEAETLIEDLLEQNVRVKLLKCDVSVKSDVEAALQTAEAIGPIKGILQAAVVLQDRVFASLSHAQWKQGLAAKVFGTLNLHEVTGVMELDLDFFIMTSSFEAVMALPTQAAYCAANSFQDAFARYRRSQGLVGTAIAFGLITEIGEMGQREAVRKMIYRNGLYRTGELDFLRLLEAAFLEAPDPSPTATWQGFDPLAEAQITTCLEPAELAKIARQQGDIETQTPRWHSDKKFSHLLQAMKDCMTTKGNVGTAKVEVPSIALDVDEAIGSDKLQNAQSLVIGAVIDRVASLLFLAPQSIDAAKSIAHYGVDSLVAVELRNWIGKLFDDTIPLLTLLDESISISSLADMIVNKRKVALDRPES